MISHLISVIAYSVISTNKNACTTTESLSSIAWSITVDHLLADHLVWEQHEHQGVHHVLIQHLAFNMCQFCLTIYVNFISQRSNITTALYLLAVAGCRYHNTASPTVQVRGDLSPTHSSMVINILCDIQG